MRFLSTMSSMVLLACVACGASNGDVSAPVPATDPGDPNFRPDEPQDPNFRSNVQPVVQDDGSVDSGATVSSDGDTVDVDSGVVATNDSGRDAVAGDTDSGYDPTDPTDPTDAVCQSGVKLTCEQALHCCMNGCKVLAGVSCGNGHVACVHRCAEAHEECVEDRRKANCNKWEF